MCKNFLFNKMFLLVSLCMCLFIVTGCERGVGDFIDKVQTGQSNEFGPIEIEDKIFQSYNGDKFSFSYPSGWFLETDGAAVVVKNTVKSTFTAAVVPNDYYLATPDGNVVNSDKYADKFSLVTLDYLEPEELISWQEYLDANFPDVVESFGKYEGEVGAGIDAVVVTGLNGVLGGEQRVFLRQGKKILDVGLFVRGVDQTDARQLFGEIVKTISFGE